MTTSGYTTAGIAAVKVGDMASARTAFTEALAANADDATAWLWLSAAVGAVEEKRYCLAQVLRIIPTSPAALKGMGQLGAGPVSTPVLYRAATVEVPAQPLAASLESLRPQPVVVAPSTEVPKKQGIGCGGGLVLLVVLLCLGLGVLTMLGRPVASTASSAFYSAQGSSLTKQAYAAQIQPHIQEMQGALGRLGELASNPRITSEGWRSEMIVQLALMRHAHQSLSAVTNVPPSLQTVHSTLIAGTADCDASTTLLANWLDTYQPEKMERATTLVKSCGAKVERANDLLASAN